MVGVRHHASSEVELLDGTKSYSASMEEIGSQGEHEENWNENEMMSFGSYASYELAAGVEKNHNAKYALKTGRPYFIYVFSGVCLLMFFIEFAVNGWGFASMQRNPTIGPSVPTLIKIGAARSDLIREGQVQRLLLPMFMNSGIIQILLNAVGLIAIGIPLERDFGTVAVMIVFFVSAFSGLLFALVLAPTTVILASSAGVCGLIGGAWGEFVLNYAFYRGRALWHLVILLGITSVYLVFGLMPLIDNFAHLGGLMGGFLTGLSVFVQNRYSIIGELKPKKTYQVILQMFSAFFTPFFVALLIILLAYGVSQPCWWCNSFSCIQFPLGAESPWWTCDQCSYLGSMDVAPLDYGLVNITCPDKEVVQAQATVDTPIDTIFEWCQHLCLN